jgi:arabinofuranan 3-O-arabinosyltransferase
VTATQFTRIKRRPWPTGLRPGPLHQSAFESPQNTSSDNSPEPSPAPPGSHRGPVLSAGFGAAGVVFFMLFRTGQFLASGDVAPLVVDGLRHELGWQWTHQTTGAGGPTYEIARTAEVAAVQLSRLLGGGEAMGQRLLYSIVWGFAAAAGAALASRFTRRRTLAIILGLATVFNPYTLIAQPNPLPMVAIGVAAAVTALACDAARGQRRRWAMLALLTFPCSYLSLNPPLLSLVIAFAVAQVVIMPIIAGGGRDSSRRIIGLLVRSAPLSAALSLWWAVPAYIAIKKADPTAVGAVTNVEAWSWTHGRSSIANVTTMFGHWSWPRPEYYGHATVIENFPWSIFRWVLPLGAIFAPFLVARARRIPAAFCTFLIMGTVFVGKGLHKPFTGANRWMYAHVPGFWLFREPAAKVGVVLIVLYTIGFAMAADALLTRFGKRERSPRTRRAVLAGGLLVAVAPLVGVWPLWTGTIVKSADATGIADRSSVPPAWREVASTVNQSPLHGKTLVLPIDDYYQIPTTWGYYGADNLVRRLLKRPVLQSDPQLYVGDSDVFETLMRTVEKTIVLNDGQGTSSLLRALGVSQIIVRRDVDFSSKKRVLRMVHPETILAGLRHVDGLRLAKSTSVADVFELTDRPGSAVEVLGGIVSVGELPPIGLALLRGALPEGLVLASNTSKGSIPELAAGRAIVQRGTSSTGTVDFGPYSSWLVSRHAAASPAFKVQVRSDGMRAEEIVKWKIAGQTPLPKSSIDLLVPGLAGVELGTRFLDRWSSGAVIRVDASTTGVPWVRVGPDSGIGNRSEVLDCNNHDNTPKSTLGITVNDIFDLYGERVELAAEHHSACIHYPIQGATPGKAFHVRLQGRSLSGSNPRYCIWVKGPETCAALPALAKEGSGDSGVSAIWKVPAGTTSADLYLYADESPDGSRTVTQYNKPVIEQVVMGSPIPLRPAPTANVDVKLKSGLQSVGARLDAKTPAVGAVGPLGDCNRMDAKTAAQAGLKRTVAGGVIGLEALTHSACVRIPFEKLTPSLPYIVSFEHRTLHGAKARYCVLEAVSGKCIANGAIEASDGAWATEQVTVDAPPQTVPQALALYVYADGSGDTGGVATRTEYRHLTINPFVDEYLALLSAGTTARRSPAMTFHQISPARYRVKVSKVAAPFVLALSDSWSKDWLVSGAPKGTKVEHLLIDGYRNGWALDARGDLDLLIEYMPARDGQLAIRLSALATLVAGGIGVTELIRRRRQRILSEQKAKLAKFLLNDDEMRVTGIAG